MFPIPSLDQCVQKTRAAFRSYLPGTDAWIWPNNIGPTAKVVGGAVSELYGRLDFIGRQKFALTASGKYLDQHGSEIGLTRKTAQTSSGAIIITALDAVSVTNGAQFARTDGVILVATAAQASTQAGTLTLPVVAAIAALAGNSQPDTPLTILSGVTGPGAVTATAAVDANGLTGGADVEVDGPFYTSDLGTFRGRILFRKRNPIQGGAPADYVTWAGAVPGVTRTFVERRYNGAGSVRIYPIFDGMFPGGIADSGRIALVQAAIDAQTPAGIDNPVVAPTPQPIIVTVQKLMPRTTAVENAVIDEISDTIQRNGTVAGVDTATPQVLAAMPFLAVPVSFASLWIDQAVADATGSKRAVVVSPAADFTIASGSIPILQSVIFD